MNAQKTKNDKRSKQMDNLNKEDGNTELQNLFDEMNAQKTKNDKLSQQMEELHNRMEDSNKAGGVVESYEAITGEIPEVDQEAKLEEALQNAIYKFIGILIIAVAVGAFIGICSVVLIGKCLRRSQNKRLELVKSRSDMQFVE